MKNISYIYRHRRLDTFEIFYVGIGTIYSEHSNSKKEQNTYFRAYTKKGRSKWWKRVVIKTDYQVEIIQDKISWRDACELEILLIS